MKIILLSALIALPNHLGRCPKCMRLCFHFMIIAWCLASVLLFATDNLVLRAASLITAAGASILWLSHVAAFAVRIATSTANKAVGVATATDAASDPSFRTQRRYALALIRGATFAAAATALPRWVFAQSCSCASPLKCCWSYGAKFYVCAARDAVCCGHATNPWPCARNQNCNGDGSTLPKCR